MEARPSRDHKNASSFSCRMDAEALAVRWRSCWNLITSVSLGSEKHENGRKVCAIARAKETQRRAQPSRPSQHQMARGGERERNEHDSLIHSPGRAIRLSSGDPAYLGHSPILTTRTAPNPSPLSGRGERSSKPRTYQSTPRDLSIISDAYHSKRSPGMMLKMQPGCYNGTISISTGTSTGY